MEEDKQVSAIPGLRQQIADLEESEPALKNKLKALILNVDLLDAILSASADPLFVMTRAGETLYADGASERIFGVDRSNAIGKAWQLSVSRRLEAVYRCYSNVRGVLV